MKLVQYAEKELEKCYSIAPLKYQGKDHILVAAEKVNKCYLFDLDGNLEDTVWDGPGGTMSMIQVPGKDGWFLATHQFYSPNDGVNAKIVLCRPGEEGWKVQNICSLPYTHRFSILERNGKYYLIACTIKTSIEYRDDWRTPGKIFVGELPADIENYDENHQVEMTLLRDGLFKNHGYCTVHGEDGDYALVGAQEGVFKVVPPAEEKGSWSVEQLIADPTSDMFLCDFDNDGQDEMITIAPFHGDHVCIYHLNDGKYEKVWECPFLMEMSHSIWARNFHGRNEAIIGCRKGTRDLVEFWYEDGEYHTNVLVHDCGSANIYPFDCGDEVRLVSTNREINQIAFYKVEK